jgi:SM-20-related protein
MPSRRLPNPYLPSPFLIIENFLLAEECALIVKETQAAEHAQQAMVKTTLLQSVVTPSIDKTVRKTAVYSLSPHLESIYQENFLKHQSKIEEYFSLALTTATILQTLVYEKGDFYIKHADDSSEIVDTENKTQGYVCVAPQRKLTTVLFASSHEEAANSPQNTTFKGGELIFNYLYDKNGNTVSITPKAGDMIVFFSNPVFSHEVTPVSDGYRVSLVQWHNALF